MSPKHDSGFIFFSFYDIIVLVAIMITNQILVFSILDQADFENDMKQI